jgi:hypothetical protein
MGKLVSELVSRPLLLHAVPELSPACTPAREEFQRFLLNTAKRETKDFQARLETKMAVVKPGDVVDTVRIVALDRRSDLVVIGRCKLHESLGSFRSNAYNIPREAPCPVVSLL